MPNSSMHELLIHEAHGVVEWRILVSPRLYMYYMNTFYLPKKKDVQKIYDKYITYIKAKSKVLSYDLYTPLPIPKEP